MATRWLPRLNLDDPNGSKIGEYLGIWEKTAVALVSGMYNNLQLLK